MHCGNGVLLSVVLVIASAVVFTPILRVLNEWINPGIRDFPLLVRAMNPTTVEIVAIIPGVRIGVVNKCYGTLWGPQGLERTFSCNDNGQEARVTLTKLDPGTAYSCTITFVHVQGILEMTYSKTAFVTTPTAQWSLTFTVGISLGSFLFIIFVSYTYRKLRGYRFRNTITPTTENDVLTAMRRDPNKRLRLIRLDTGKPFPSLTCAWEA